MSRKQTKAQRDWASVGIGALLLVASIILMLTPGITLATIALFAGIFFLCSGIFRLINFFRLRKYADLSAWEAVGGIVDVLIGLMFILHPIVLAEVVPWVAGAFMISFGLLEVLAAYQTRKAGPSTWLMIGLSGVLTILCGFCFFIVPASFVYFFTAFFIMRGITLIVLGLSRK